MMGLSQSSEIISELPSDDELTTDARRETLTMPNLNIYDIQKIEKNLEIYETISLTYLLFEDSSSALNDLDVWLKSPRKEILYNWASKEKLTNPNWSDKVLEALTIIQNYHVLRKFGLNKTDARIHYLPHQPDVALHVNRTKKGLYVTFENMSANLRKQLIEKVKSDFQEKHLPFKCFGPEFLEMYFLHWETVNYIASTDYSNLSKVVKKIEGLDEFYMFLQRKTVLQTPQKRNQLNSNINDSNNLQNRYSFSQVQTVENSSENDERYTIDPKHPGVCIIINQMNFYDEFADQYQHLKLQADLDVRIGSEKDQQQLKETFELFGFRTCIFDDVPHYDLLNKIKDVMDGMTVESSLFVCILSHGGRGVVYGVNKCPVEVNQIEKLLRRRNRENLINKPKVLILQSCQGTRCQNEIESEEEDEMTTDGNTNHAADLLTVWATVPGFAAIRNKRLGSWFIQALCEQMKEFGHSCHFSDICTKIIRDVTNKRWEKDGVVVGMTPYTQSTLTKNIYLPKYK